MRAGFSFTAITLALCACRTPGEAAGAPPPGATPGASSTPASVASTAPEASAPAPAASASPPPEPPWPPPPPEAVSDFCIELVHALDEETCYVLPDERPSEVLIYLHGIVPPAPKSVQKTNFETVVANAARRAGVAALIPRGRQGLAGGGRKQWWGWPTSATQHERHAEELVASLLKRQEKLEALVGRAFQRRYVAGSSAGAYFVAALALHGDIEAAGFGAMSGGARAFGAKPEALAPVPFYIGHGNWDPVGAAAEGLATLLRAAKWPVQVRKHPLPHGAREVYLDEAFSFWRAPPAKP